MGGYAVYVWPAFLLTGLIMIVLVVASVRSLKRASALLSRLQTDPGE